MYIRIITALVLTALIGSTQAYAQEAGEKEKNVKKNITISNEGISINKEPKEREKSFKLTFGMVDLGLNSLQDKTDYNNLSTAADQFLNVPQEFKNEELFNLRGGKSWNVNVYPVMATVRYGGKPESIQKAYFSTGVMLQMYNFRFTRPVTYTNTVTPEVYLDSVQTITKNKLGFTYLSIPLMFTFKTKVAEKVTFVYGVGVTGGYRLASWMKQVSNENGKQKNHDQFNFNDFNSCITAEFGLDNIFRLYASYQLTPLHENHLVQRPFSIGLRFSSI